MIPNAPVCSGSRKRDTRLANPKGPRKAPAAPLKVHMARSLVLLCLILPLLSTLTGCGVAETGAGAAAEAASKAEEVRQGLAAEARVREQLDAANQKAAEQREAAEAQ